MEDNGYLVSEAVFQHHGQRHRNDHLLTKWDWCAGLFLCIPFHTHMNNTLINETPLLEKTKPWRFFYVHKLTFPKEPLVLTNVLSAFRHLKKIVIKQDNLASSFYNCTRRKRENSDTPTKTGLNVLTQLFVSENRRHLDLTVKLGFRRWKQSQLYSSMWYSVGALQPLTQWHFTATPPSCPLLLFVLTGSSYKDPLWVFPDKQKRGL